MGGEKRRRAPLLDKLEPGSLSGGSNKPRNGPGPDKIYNDVNHAIGQAWMAFLSFFDIKVPKSSGHRGGSFGGSKKKKKKGGILGDII